MAGSKKWVLSLKSFFFLAIMFNIGFFFLYQYLNIPIDASPSVTQIHACKLNFSVFDADDAKQRVLDAKRRELKIIKLRKLYEQSKKEKKWLEACGQLREIEALSTFVKQNAIENLEQEFKEIVPLYIDAQKELEIFRNALDKFENDVQENYRKGKVEPQYYKKAEENIVKILSMVLPTSIDCETMREELKASQKFAKRVKRNIKNNRDKR